MRTARLILLGSAAALLACAPPTLDDPGSSGAESDDADTTETESGHGDEFGDGDGDGDGDGHGDGDGDGEGDGDGDGDGDVPLPCADEPCNVFDGCCDGYACVDGTCEASGCNGEDVQCGAHGLNCCEGQVCDEESGTCQPAPQACSWKWQPCNEDLPCCEAECTGGLCWWG